jgi:hypothetical protein
MHRRLPCVAAIALLLTLPSVASAGTSYLLLTPISGYGYGVDDNGITGYFTTNDASLTIVYDPDNLTGSYLTLDAGGYSATTDSDFTVSVVRGGVQFSGLSREESGQTIGAFVYGDPGPLDVNGNPLTLDGLTNYAYVGAMPGYHIGFYFNGSVPEPSSLLSFAIGIVAVVLIRRKRRTLRFKSGV